MAIYLQCPECYILPFTVIQEEQDFADAQSTAVNEAYDALLKPVPRALYLLKLNGLSLEENITLEPEFLMDIMEINEEVAGTPN